MGRAAIITGDHAWLLKFQNLGSGLDSPPKLQTVNSYDASGTVD